MREHTKILLKKVGIAVIVIVILVGTLSAAFALNDTEVDQIRTVVRQETQNITVIQSQTQNLTEMQARINAMALIISQLNANSSFFNTSYLNISNVTYITPLDLANAMLSQQQLIENRFTGLENITRVVCSPENPYLNNSLGDPALTTPLQGAIDGAMSNAFDRKFKDQQAYFEQTLLPSTQEKDLLQERVRSCESAQQLLTLQFQDARVQANLTQTNLEKDNERLQGDINTLWWVIGALGIILVITNWDDIRSYTKKY